MNIHILVEHFQNCIFENFCFVFFLLVYSFGELIKICSKYFPLNYFKCFSITFHLALWYFLVEFIITIFWCFLLWFLFRIWLMFYFQLIAIFISICRFHSRSESTFNAGDLGWIPGLGRSPGEGKGSPLQYSDLENSMDCMGLQKVDTTEQLSLSFSFLIFSFISIYLFSPRAKKHLK